MIKTIVDARDVINPREPEISDELIPEPIQDELSEFNLTPTNPANELLLEGLDHRYGIGDFIQDFPEAIRCFTQAAKLGSLDALLEIGEMHEDGQGVRRDTDKALRYYKEAVRKGHFVGLGMMARLFDAVHRQNADKLWGLFFSKWAEKGSMKPYLSDWRQPSSIAFNFFSRYFDSATVTFHFSEDMAIWVEMVRAHRDDMLTVADTWLEKIRDPNATYDRRYEFYRSVRDWIAAA